MIVHDVLDTVAQEGIEETSAYYISFQTNRPDVIIPDFVRARYPEEMMIVLEHQFDDLTVSETDFSVQLTFGGISARVCVPFRALTQFADPRHQFGLTLIPDSSENDVEKPVSAKIMSLDDIRRAQQSD